MAKPNSRNALKAISGYDSLDAFAEFVLSLLETEYGLAVKALPALHIGFGLAVEAETPDANYFLKCSSLEAHSHPDDLIAWWAELQVQNYPIPHLIRTKNWKWYLTPWEDAVVYLMTKLSGQPRKIHTQKTLDQFIEWLAAIHSWGEQYPHDNRGSLANWNEKWEQRQALLKALEPFDFLDQYLITRAMQEIEALGPQAFTEVIVHGDARLCHAFYEGEAFAGFIDFDQSTQGERWIDLCYGLISGPEPHSGSQLTLEQVQYGLKHYHEWLKIPANEQAALKAHFAFAGLETLAELAKFHQRGVLPLEDIRKTESLLIAILTAETLVE
ncbi:MAG: phosphotransferase [Anaerolineae bacterium]|nr:phosphotransferase [Anaerolineae bacterium]